MSARLAELLSARLGPRFALGEPLAGYTTFRVGGPAWGLARPANEPELAFALAAAAEEKMPVVVLGACSNVLVSDSGLEALVLLIRGAFDELAEERRDERTVVVRAGAGLSIARLIAACIERGWAGLEFAAGIPGTLGGALRMNAGTRDGEIFDLVTEVRVMLGDGRIEQLPRADIEFGYREARLPAGSVTLGCRLALRPGDPAQIRAAAQSMLDWRAAHHPQHLPCAGSVFRNPTGQYAAKLIEAAGCKGLRVGGACVSEQHANFIVNDRGGSAADIHELIGLVRQRVREACGISLECEVKLLGEFA